jgi:hypothetical protein
MYYMKTSFKHDYQDCLNISLIVYYYSLVKEFYFNAKTKP